MIQANFLIYCQIPGGLEVTFDDAADLLLALLGTTVFSTPIWFIVMVKYGKKRTYIGALLGLAAMALSLYNNFDIFKFCFGTSTVFWSISHGVLSSSPPRTRDLCIALRASQTSEYDSFMTVL